VHDFDSGDAGVAEARGELGGELFCGERNDARTPANGLLKGFFDVAARGERDDGVALRKLLNDGEGALPDGEPRMARCFKKQLLAVSS